MGMALWYEFAFKMLNDSYACYTIP